VVLSVRDKIKLITDYPIRIEEELRKAEVHMMRLTRDKHSKKILAAL
jgi:hypothetical protein